MIRCSLPPLLMLCLLLLGGKPTRAQIPAPASRFTLGVGAGNGLSAFAGYERNAWLVRGRTRYKWWVPEAAAEWRFTSLKTRSRQTEAALLLGWVLHRSNWYCHGAAGLAYLDGRALGEFRYAVRRGLFGGRQINYFAYRRYRAVGLPLELGVQWEFAQAVRLGLTTQANLNPQQSDVTVLATFAW